MKSDFVSTVSHELRTPLTSIYGFAETLLRQDVLFGEEERATFLRYIASESERLTSIVDRLLSVAQLDTGDMAVQLAETDVARRRQRGGALARGQPTARTGTASSSSSPTSRSRPRPTATSSARSSRTCSTTRSGTRRPAAPSRSPHAAATTRSRSASRTRASASRTPSRSGSSASSTAAMRPRRAPSGGAPGLGLFLAEGLVTAMGGRIWVDSDEGAARRSCSSCAPRRVRHDRFG